MNSSFSTLFVLTGKSNLKINYIDLGPALTVSLSESNSTLKHTHTKMNKTKIKENEGTKCLEPGKKN